MISGDRVNKGNCFEKIKKNATAKQEIWGNRVLKNNML
jgi:hypothetical protein